MKFTVKSITFPIQFANLSFPEHVDQPHYILFQMQIGLPITESSRKHAFPFQNNSILRTLLSYEIRLFPL
jgi:hypothetical protein